VPDPPLKAGEKRVSLLFIVYCLLFRDMNSIKLKRWAIILYCGLLI